jgi:uncharacterized membrane protein YtjA (UPF0391 family)
VIVFQKHNDATRLEEATNCSEEASVQAPTSSSTSRAKNYVNSRAADCPSAFVRSSMDAHWLWRVYCSATDMRSAQMLSLVITLLIIALIAGILGFGGIAGAAVGIAKIVFFVALVLFVISLLTTGFRGGFGRRL